MKRLHIFFIACLLTAMATSISGCKQKKKTPPRPVTFHHLYLYTTQEVSDPQTQVIRQVPLIERSIEMADTLSLEAQLNNLLDTLSATYFNGLKVSATVVTDSLQSSIAKIYLQEPAGFVMPDSIGNYRSWYDYFQGSSGGEYTGIVLTETVLQRDYKGAWIRSAEFYYQGKPFGEWDHVLLTGELKR